MDGFDPRRGAAHVHIHFFISAPGDRHLTTQINLSDDPYLHDDFAYATRDELIAEIRFSDDQQMAREFGVEGRFAQIDFDVELQVTDAPVEQKRMQRVHALSHI
ncbi:protocatechuate 3,4-dioxygenase beta subunit [Pseudomonas grimontii]|nr:protocatechuate 3,4-dioxygenase beta subunit [Pseudomonas grimontii]